MNSALSSAKDWALSLPSSQLKVEWDDSCLRLLPIRLGAAGLEFLHETDSLFTVSLAGETMELELATDLLLEVCRSVSLGQCLHYRWFSGQRVLAVRTEIGQSICYTRKSWGYSINGPGVLTHYCCYALD